MAITLKKVSGELFHKQAILADKLKIQMEESLTASISKIKKITLGKAKINVVHDSVEITVPAGNMAEVLASIGMVAPAPEPKKVRIEAGDRVVVTNQLFPWVTTYQPGSGGKVVKTYSPIKEAVQYGDKFGILDVELDSGVRVLLHTWEVDCVK